MLAPHPQSSAKRSTVVATVPVTQIMANPSAAVTPGSRPMRPSTSVSISMSVRPIMESAAQITASSARTTRAQPLPASTAARTSQKATLRLKSPSENPPQSGTVWFSPDILTDNDPTAFVDLTSTGQGSRVMYDRRTESFETFNAHLFDALFGTDTNCRDSGQSGV